MTSPDNQIFIGLLNRERAAQHLTIPGHVGDLSIASRDLPTAKDRFGDKDVIDRIEPIPYEQRRPTETIPLYVGATMLANVMYDSSPATRIQVRHG